MERLPGGIDDCLYLVGGEVLPMAFLELLADCSVQITPPLQLLLRYAFDVVRRLGVLEAFPRPTASRNLFIIYFILDIILLGLLHDA